MTKRPETAHARPAPAEVTHLRSLVERAAQEAAAFESRTSLKTLSEALRLARRLHDPRAEAQALSIATQCHYQRGDYLAAVATGIDACATLSRNDLGGSGHALHGVAMAFFSVSEFRRAEAAGRRAVLYATIDHDPLLEASARSTLAFILADGGRHDEALAELKAARAKFKKLGETLRVKKATSNTGHVWRKHGVALAHSHERSAARTCWRRAMRYYRMALAIGRSRLDDAIILGSLGECAWRLGHPGEALAFLRMATQRIGPRDTPRIVSHIELRRGQAEQDLERWAAAERDIRAAVHGAAELENDALVAEARLAMASLAQARGDMEGARHWRREAHRWEEQRRSTLARFRRDMRPLWDRYLRAEE